MYSTMILGGDITMNVIKRNGSEVVFDENKILNAVLAVNKDCTAFAIVSST